MIAADAALPVIAPRRGGRPIGPGAPDLHVSSKLAKGRFSIGGGKPGQEVSWQLTGIRRDAWANAHRIPVEETKPKGEAGLYLHPVEHGKPADKGLNARRPRPKTVRPRERD